MVRDVVLTCGGLCGGRRRILCGELCSAAAEKGAVRGRIGKQECEGVSTELREALVTARGELLHLRKGGLIKTEGQAGGGASYMGGLQVSANLNIREKSDAQRALGLRLKGERDCIPPWDVAVFRNACDIPFQPQNSQWSENSPRLPILRLEDMARY